MKIIDIISEAKNKNCGCGKDPCETYGTQREAYDPKYGHDTFSHVVKHKDDNDQIFYGVYNADGMITHVFYNEKKAKDFAANNHDDLMNNRITPAGEMPKELPTGEKIKPGSKILLSAFGVGLSWSHALYKYPESTIFSLSSFFDSCYEISK